MADKKYTWYKIADHIHELHFADNGMAVAEVKGKKICMARWNEQVFAFAFRCPHAGAMLANGFIDSQGNVVCPHHRYKFCLSNGNNVSGEGFYLKHWPVLVHEEAIYVGMDENSGLFG